MKWNTPPNMINKLQFLRKFAFFPTNLDNGNTIWLESYVEVGRHEVGYDDYGWCPIRRYQESEKKD